MNRILRTLPVLLLLLGITYFFLYKQMPEYSLQQVVQATQTHNREKFEKYVDVNALSESLAEQFTAYIKAHGMKSPVQPDVAQLLSQKSQPELRQTFRAIVKDYIQYGKYPNGTATVGYPATASPEAMLMRLQDYVVKELQFRGFQTVNKADGFAQVTAHFDQPDNRQHPRLTLKLIDRGNYWQIVGMNNLDAFMREVH